MSTMTKLSFIAPLLLSATVGARTLCPPSWSINVAEAGLSIKSVTALVKVPDLSPELQAGGVSIALEAFVANGSVTPPLFIGPGQ